MAPCTLKLAACMCLYVEYKAFMQHACLACAKQGVDNVNMQQVQQDLLPSTATLRGAGSWRGYVPWNPLTSTGGKTEQVREAAYTGGLHHSKLKPPNVAQMN